MKRLFLLLLLVCWAATSVAAQDQPVVLEFELVHSEAAPQRRILDTEVWRREISAGKHRVLESGRSVGAPGQDALVHIGVKRPVAYHDPRVGASQVQYTDLGFKADWTPKLLANGIVEVNIRTEKAQLVQPDLPTSTVYLQEAIVHLKRGQTAILAGTRGVLTAKYFAPLYPEVKFGENSTMMLVISIK